ncbi:MAG: hypothetical protein JW709_07700 [Sedimentisphaerales bacterium]|nr:hypothetical protein [Sedimentisphaerales bacterium]
MTRSMKNNFFYNDLLGKRLLPTDFVFAPSWWNDRCGITFDKDFFYHPAKRVEVEQQMEKGLYERWGDYGMGQDHNCLLPQLGPVHLAAGYLISEMLGCEVQYNDDTPPQVIPAHQNKLTIDVEGAFESKSFKRFVKLTDALKQQHGSVVGDVNWSGILNLAMDLRGESVFIDLFEKPEESQEAFNKLGQVIETFVKGITEQTGTSSISVNRTVRHLQKPVFLHSECSHTMISADMYEKFLLNIDAEWSKRHRPFGVHYCGADPHRFAASYAKLPHLDFLDVGWGGDVAMLRKYLPHAFFNIRLSPVELIGQSPDEVRTIIKRLVHDAENPYLTGLCCINMDKNVDDIKITAILKTIEDLREEYRKQLAP